tara:strand:+ start:209 stop:466 length:258 start_codon:yes stop_codon:yes gene_type:complete
MNNTDLRKRNAYQSNYHNTPRGEERDRINAWYQADCQSCARWELKGYDKDGNVFGPAEHTAALKIINEKFLAERAAWEKNFPKSS